MANLCEYEIHVKGTKKSTLMLFSSMPWLDYNEIRNEIIEDGNYIVHFNGNCKWSLNSYCNDTYEGKGFNIEELEEENIKNNMAGLDLCYYTLREKSRLLNCEIQAHSWCGESGFSTFEHYKNGEIIKFKCEGYVESYDLDWDLEECPNLEDLYDEYGLEEDDLSDVEIEEVDEFYKIIHVKGYESITDKFDF